MSMWFAIHLETCAMISLFANPGKVVEVAFDMH